MDKKEALPLIKTAYIRGDGTLRQLADKYGLGRGVVFKASRAEKWPALRAQAESKAEARVVDKVAAAKARRADKLDKAVGLLLDEICALISGCEKALSTREIKDLTGALKDLRDVGGVKNELDLEEQKARIAKLRREAAGEDGGRQIRVVIGAEAAELGE